MPAVAKKSRPAAKAQKATPVKKQPLVLVNRPAKFSPKNPPLGTPERHEKGIIFVKHLPHGFFEKQLRAFFCQFGDVTRVHVARSKRTLRSKGYAYVEFRYREVAQIAQETMDNYLMFGKILKTVMLPANARRIPRQYEKAFDRDGKETTTYRVWLKKAVARQNGKPVTKTKAVERNQRALAKLKKAKEQFKTIGVNYDVDEVTPAFAPDQLRKPDHDPEEEASKAKRSKRQAKKKQKQNESVDESLLEKLPVAGDSDDEEEEDSSDDDLDASFAPLEPEDWDEPGSSGSEGQGEVSSAGDKKSALQFAAKAKVRLDKEKQKKVAAGTKRAPTTEEEEEDSPVKANSAPVSKRAKVAAKVESSPEVVKEQKQGKKKLVGGVTKKKVAAAAAAGKKGNKVVKEVREPVKAAAKALLADDSVRKVKGKDIKKKKNKK